MKKQKKRKPRWVAWFEKPQVFYTKKELLEACKGRIVLYGPIRK